MDPQRELERMLKEHNAVLVRSSKHLVYRLPNGQNFVMPNTPGDHYRGANNQLKDLRRALGIVRVAPEEKGSTMQVTPTQSPVPAPAISAPAVEEPQPPSFKDRLDAAIATEEAHQEKLMAEAQQVERRVQMLKALQPFVDDRAAEEALRAILPDPKPPRPAAPPEPPRAAPPPAPPQVITERVQVTRHLVLAATQTFEDTFTVNDVLALMTGGRQIEPPERFRVRSSIAQCMVGLCERGELVRVADGIGKRQTIWQRAVLNRHGTRA